MQKKNIVLLSIVGAAVIGIGLMYNSLVGYNESGERRFVQEYFGHEKVIFKPGPFSLLGGTDERYANVLTVNNTGADGKCEYERGDGFKVQYADGGYGAICVQAQFPLPNDEGTMKAMHKRFYSEKGIETKLILPALQSMYTTTAKLYTSTEAYSTKSAEIQNDSKYQILNGQYVTDIEVKQVEAGVDEQGNVILQSKEVAVIKRKGGVPLTSFNDFDEWGMSQTIQIQITGFDFENKTIDQIGLRRDATNRAETAQANAKAAYWETEQKRADGEKARVEEEYKQKKLAEVEIQQKEKEKRLAIIDAERQKEQATMLAKAATEKLAQKKADVLTAKATAQEIEILSLANAAAIDREQQAGELFKRIEAEVTMNKDLTQAIATMNMPTNMFISSGDSSEGGSEMKKLLQLQVLEKMGSPVTTK